jgi:predicted DsbA family dithiol-disulfide isomerase
VRIERLKREFQVDVEWVHFPLHPETPDEGRSLADLFAGRGVDVDAMFQRMKGLMDAEGLPYGRRTHTYNSRLAQELGKWADTRPGGEALHDALYRAYFVDARNIGDPEVLVELAESVGLPGEEARQVIEERRFRDAVDADWQKSRQYGVTGVPTFVAGGLGVVGAQPYETLADLTGAACDDECEDAVDADEREEQGDTGERAEKDGSEAFFGEGLTHEVAKRSDLGDGEIRIQVPDDGA